MLPMPPASRPTAPTCAICALHLNSAQLDPTLIWRGEHWLLRHHPHPSPLVGWCLLDVRRHCAGPVDFSAAEAADWGLIVQRASRLVKHVSGCNRVYAIAFGEGARHLHLHLIPRCNGIPETEAWAVADLYRDVQHNCRAAAAEIEVEAWIQTARQKAPRLMGEGPEG